jgi:IS5 family transposase
MLLYSLSKYLELSKENLQNPVVQDRGMIKSRDETDYLCRVHTLVTTAGSVHDVTQAQDLLHGEETDVFADSGYRGVEKRE